MTISVGVGGTHKAVNAISVGVGGAWKTVTDAWVGVGGAWKKVYEAISYPLPDPLNNTTAQVGGTVRAGFNFSTDGTYGAYDTTGQFIVAEGDWVDPGAVGIGSDYEIRCTTISGTLAVGNTGVWEALSSAREYSVQRATNGTTTYSGTIEIRRASDSVVVASVTMSLSAERAI